MATEYDIDVEEEVFLPCYRHLLDADADINLLWGGRDSGKSHFTAEKMVIDCVNEPYFRCLLGKKTANSIKESQWQTIKDIVEDWGIEHLFEFKEHPLSITCVNGNRFICRGFDEPKKLKSLRNVNRAWLEEGNQMEEADFITVLTTLRSNDGDVKIWLSFNPETDEDFEEFWLFKLFFKHQKRNIYNCNFTDKISIRISEEEEVSFRFTSTHTTYHDNPEWVTPLRRAFHETLARINPYYYNIFTKGIWATMKPGQLWAFAFDEQRHIGTPVLNRAQTVYLSFDFNKNPICCSVIQHYDGKLRVLETIKLENSDIYALCKYIMVHYPKCLFLVTGDATGKATTALVQDNLNFYKVIRQQLRLSPEQIKVPTINPKLEDNQVLVNSILAHYPVEIHGDKASWLKYDLNRVKTLADGSIDKTNRADPTKQADALDTLRYWMNQFMGDFITRFLTGKK